MEHPDIFMNLRTDFAFKKVFGSEEHKNVLIRFLNIIFREDDFMITDVVFLDKELLPHDKSELNPSKKGKRIVYDVYCTTQEEDRRHFIVEMQQEDNGLFLDRSVYYATKAVSMQGSAGWDYTLCPVYSIFILGFNFSHMSKRLTHDIRLMDRETHELFNDKFRMIFISLPEVKRRWEDCKTEYDKILFIIKNIHKMTKESKPYTSGEYRDLFDASEIGSMAAEDVVLYSQSYMKMRENELAVEYAAKKAAKKAAEKAEARGEARGRTEGRAEGIVETLEKFKKLGVDPEIIRQVMSQLK